ncbi:hypothetical protein LJR153_007166 [Paenibacillus sp. LjRoot153]|uniref:hypothetical protein n=1 Tax=Paenibacillus sp. LjRoot153 TaxID=3342270 RepID=UPI003ECD4E50
MDSKLIIVEGLPGFGKSTTAQLISDILKEMKFEAALFMEGDLEHPADYEGVACFTKNEFRKFLSSCNEEFRDLFNKRVFEHDNNYFLLPYRKIENELGLKLPDEISTTVIENDIYELPLHQNINLITDKWSQFTGSALNSGKVYVFECCFIQNPVTVGMIKYGFMKEEVINHVTNLATIIESLNPLLIYIEQTNIEFSFNKAVKERPIEWSIGFINYYTNQGYGKERGYTGLAGTIQVLKARADLENEILDKLNIKMVRINNSTYDINLYKSELVSIIKSHFLEPKYNARSLKG